MNIEQYELIEQLKRDTGMIELNIEKWINVALQDYDEYSLEYRNLKKKIYEFVSFLNRYNSDEYPLEAVKSMGLDKYLTFLNVSHNIFNLMRQKQNNLLKIENITSFNNGEHQKRR